MNNFDWKFWLIVIITQEGEKTHGFNREDDSPPLLTYIEIP